MTELQLKYQSEPFSISRCQADLWKVLYLRKLERISSIPSSEESEIPNSARLKYSSLRKVGLFIPFQGPHTNSLGLTLDNSTFSYFVRLRSRVPLSDFALYHGASRAELCVDANFQPVKYCGELLRLDFCVTGYHHLYFTTSTALNPGDVTVKIDVTRGPVPTCAEKTYQLRTQSQSLVVCKSRRVGSDVEFSCPREAEQMFRHYATALRKEMISFPPLVRDSLAEKTSLSIHFERQPGYTSSYVFASVTDDLQRRGYIRIEHGKKLEMKYKAVKFSHPNVSARSWVLRAYGTNRHCLGSWSCASSNVDFVFDQTESVRFVIENISSVNDPGTVELETYSLLLLPASG